MYDAAALTREARTRRGWSLRALAERSDVSYTTISRIEQGHVDPTIGTLRKLLHALGAELDLQHHPLTDAPELAGLATAWSLGPSGAEPDWTRLRAFLDELALHPDLADRSIRGRPPKSGSPFVDNLLAGIAEKIADDHRVRRPAWTKRVTPQHEPWQALGTPRMRAAHAEATPRQLAERHIYLPTASLWRSGQ